MLLGCCSLHAVAPSNVHRQRHLPQVSAVYSSEAGRRAHARSVRVSTGHAKKRRCCCYCTDASQTPESGASTVSHQVAVEGDTVTVQYKCMNNKGEIIETSDTTEPLTFEVGAGEVMGNKMFQAFDAGVRGLQVGEKTYLEASGGEWNKDLLFSVPRAHEEVQRLEGRYKSVGGLKEGLVVELSNQSNAMVLEVTDDIVRLDANNMMAGQTLMFELELVSIEPGRRASSS